MEYKCKNCGAIHDDSDYGDIIIDDKYYCEECGPIFEEGQKWIVCRTPSFCDCHDIIIYKFNEVSELVRKLKIKNSMIGVDGYECNNIMSFGIDEKFWCVEGNVFIRKYGLSLLYNIKEEYKDIPTFEEYEGFVNKYKGSPRLFAVAYTTPEGKKIIEGNKSLKHCKKFIKWCANINEIYKSESYKDIKE